MSKILNSSLELVGNTPIVRLSRLEKKLNLEFELYAKLEEYNPAGSVKDRIAKAMIEDAEKKGLLKPGATIIESTSGNTGIGLCSVAAVKGYKVILTMPESMPIERRKLMKAYGAELILTEGPKGMRGANEKAAELLKEIPNSFMPSQFENPQNPNTHYLTTGPEIYESFEGKVDILVAGVGTGGTISGTGKYLKEKIDGFKVVAVEPFDSPVLTQGKAGPHKITGIGAGFVPNTLNTSIYDEVITVQLEDAFNKSRLCGVTEGVLIGVSSGAALNAAIEVGSRAENKGKKIIVIFPDNGERYLSTDLYA